MVNLNKYKTDVDALAKLLAGIKRSLAVEDLNMARIWPSRPMRLSREFTQLLADAVRALPRLKRLSFSFKPIDRDRCAFCPFFACFVLMFSVLCVLFLMLKMIRW